MSYWKQAPSGLIVPHDLDTRPWLNTCVAPGPLGDPGRPERRRHPLGHIVVENGTTLAPSSMQPMKAKPFGNLDPDRTVMRTYCDENEPREVKC